MNIEFNQILTFVSVVAAVYFAFKSNSRANNDEVSKKAQVDAILSQKLDSISDDTKEIRKEITDVKVKVNDLSERVVMVEQSTKSAHHRLDRYEEEEIYHGKPRNMVGMKGVIPDEPFRFCQNRCGVYQEVRPGVRNRGRVTYHRSSGVGKWLRHFRAGCERP